MVTGNYGISLGSLGRYTEAVAAGWEAVALADRTGHALGKLHANAVLTRMLTVLGQWDEAVSIAESGLAMPGSEERWEMLMSGIVLIALHRGQRDGVASLLEEMQRRQDHDGLRYDPDLRMAREVARAWLSDEPEHGLELFALAADDDYSEWPGWVPAAVDLLLAQPEAAPWDVALLSLRGLPRPLRTPVVAAQIERLAGHRAHHAGDAAAAQRHWATAERVSADAGLEFNRAVLALERIEQSPDHLGSDDALARSARIFERIGADPWLERARLGGGMPDPAGARPLAAASSEHRDQ
jgi:hypothetical protein